MKRIVLTGMILALAITAAACSGNKKVQTDSAPAATSGASQGIDAFGVVTANEVKNINLDFTATVDKVLVKDGQKVKSNDVLMSLNTSAFLTQLSNKELELTEAKLGLQKEQVDLNRLGKDLTVKKGYLANNTDPDIKKYLSDLGFARQQYTDAVKDLNKKQSLYDTHTISLSELEAAKKDADMKKQSISTIQYELDSLRYTKQKEIDQLQATYDQKSASSANASSTKLSADKITALENELKLLQAQLHQSYIKQNNLVSDISNGIVYDIGYVAGDIISPQKKVLSILNLDSLVVQADVSEEFIKDVRLEAEATIIPQADKSKTYKGKVVRIADKALLKNNETVVPVQISIEGQDGFLLPDFNVDVKISVPKK